MQSEFITPDDPRWNEALETAQPDVYDLPEYVRVCAKYENGAAIAFHASEGAQRCLIPLLERPLPVHLGAPASWSDTSSPYGYSSALFVGDAEWARRAVHEFVGACHERDIVSAFVRLHPLLAVPGAAMDAGIQVTHGNTVYIDLALPEGVLHKQLRKGHKLNIAKLSADGFKVTIDDWTRFDEFMQIYWDTMSRLDADPLYHLPAGYFHDLREALGSRLHLLSVIAPDQSVGAAGLFTEMNGMVQYHLSGTAPQHQRSAPTKLMIERAKAWAKAAGNRVLHLGGGVGARGDSLYDFKAGFSPLRSAFQTWRVICNPKRYCELAGASSACSDGFFPAYRKTG